MYYRKVEITEYEGTGLICGWYVCGAYPVTSVVGSRGGWDFGFNVGAGIGFRMGDDAEFFVESRYHYVAGGDVEVPPVADAGERDQQRMTRPAATGRSRSDSVSNGSDTPERNRSMKRIADGVRRGDRDRRDDDGRRGSGAVQDSERCR